jgi:hypothetical protein
MDREFAILSAKKKADARSAAGLRTAF